MTCVRNDDWNPDPQIMAKIKEEISKLPAEQLRYGRISSGDKLLTWSEFITEIELGTEFGRMIYYIYVDDDPEQ